MSWLVAASKILKTQFQNKAFSVEDALSVLEEKRRYTHNVVYQILHELVKRGVLIRVSRGVYKFPSKEVALHETINLSDEVAVEIKAKTLNKAEKILRHKGIEFMLTGPSTLTRFHHLLPRRLMHLIYVIKGAGEFAIKSLDEAQLRAILNPSRREIEMALDLLKDKDLFIIREFSRLDGNVDGRACLERALVDTYFETTRDKIPYSELEVGRIIKNTFRNENVNITRLLRLAGRRGIKTEFNTIINELVPDYPIKGKLSSKYGVSVLHGLKG
jgi:hypothetical protein